MTDWKEVDRILSIASPFILTEEERERVARIEQSAYESNLPRIREMLETHQSELQQRQFWTELQAGQNGLRFRYSRLGFYGPGGFSSQLHVAGPLVLGTIHPKGDAVASFYPNNIDENTFIGERFDDVAFARFIADNLMNYLVPENQILSMEHYQWIRALLGSAEHE
jgi:hypothetical protein